MSRDHIIINNNFLVVQKLSFNLMTFNPWIIYWPQFRHVDMMLDVKCDDLILPLISYGDIYIAAFVFGQYND